MALDKGTVAELNSWIQKYPQTGELFKKWGLNMNDLEDMVRECDENSLSLEAIFYYTNHFDSHRVPTTGNIVGRIIMAIRKRAQFRLGTDMKSAADIFGDLPPVKEEAKLIKVKRKKPRKKYEHKLTVRLTSNQLKALEKISKEDDISKSTILRERMFGCVS